MTDIGGSQRGHRPTQPRAVQWPGTFLMTRVWVDREVSNIRRNTTTKFLRLQNFLTIQRKLS